MRENRTRYYILGCRMTYIVPPKGKVQPCFDTFEEQAWVYRRMNERILRDVMWLRREREGAKS